MGVCLVCHDGNEYCIEGVPPLPSNPLFWYGVEAQSMLDICIGGATISEFEKKPIGNNLSQYAHVFFDHGT